MKHTKTLHGFILYWNVSAYRWKKTQRKPLGNTMKNSNGQKYKQSCRRGQVSRQEEYFHRIHTETHV